ncbi:MAG: CooT family nickel-binding protein [Dehalococcoidales bacterium]|nr:CooT family nickel-binding protein [Dehalococcoidales bacterium]
MCLSKAYFERNGERQLVAEEVSSMEIDGSRLRLKTLFGELKEVEARVREVDFLTHSILLEGPKESGASL